MRQHLATGLSKGGAGCKGYKDWREVLDRPDIDIMHIPTPPHWHALISIAAAEGGQGHLVRKADEPDDL